MSPAQGRKQFVPSRPRAEVFTAVAVGVAIAVGTLLIIWLIRPGSPGVSGEGGLLSRQPRMTLLMLSTAAAIIGWVVYVLRRRHPPKIGTKGAIGIGVAVIVVLAGITGVFWPGGAVRHWNDGSSKTPVTIPTPAATTPTTPTTQAR